MTRDQHQPCQLSGLDKLHKAVSSLVTLSSYTGAFDRPHRFGAFSIFESPRELQNQSIAPLVKLTISRSNMSPPRGIPDSFRSNRPRSKSDKQIQKPTKAVFGDLASAHSSITSRTRSGFLNGQTSTKGDSQAARCILRPEDVSQGNSEDPKAMDQPLARNRSNAPAPGEGVPFLSDEIAVDHPSMADPDNERTQMSNPTGGCYLNTSLSNCTIDGALLDTYPTSRNYAVPAAIAFKTKQLEDNEFEPVAAGTNTTRVRRSASVSDMGRHYADYPVSMYPDHGDTLSGFDTAYDNPFRGFATSIHDHGNGMLPKSSSLGQYSSKIHHDQVPAGLGRADLTQGFHEARDFVGNDPQNTLKSSTLGSIVQEYSSEDLGGKLQVHEAHDQRAEYEMLEDLTQYEAEGDEDLTEGGGEDSWDGSDAATGSGEEPAQGAPAPAALASLEDTEPMVDDHNPPFIQFAFSDFAFSPQTSDDGHSIDGHSVDDHFVGGVETFSALSYQAPGQNTNPTLPSSAPVIPLPPSPPSCFQRQATPVARDNSSTTGDCSQSSGSYGHTRNLLELSSPQRPELQHLACSASGRPSSEKSNTTESAHPSNPELEGSSMKTSSTSFNQREGVPPATASNSDRSFPRVSIIDPDGSIHSRPLSVHQARTLEAEIASHLRRASDISTQTGHGSDFEPPIDQYTYHGRLSIDFSDNDDDVLEDLGPGGRQSSSSQDFLSGSGSYVVNAPRSGRVGRPGLYHDSLISDLRDDSPDPMRGRARDGLTQDHGMRNSLSGADSGTMSDAHTYDDAQADDGKDWETVAESCSFSRHGPRNAIGRGRTGSSLADYSDSGSLSPPKLAPLFSHRALQHPPHPRYAPRSFGLMRDEQNGELVLMPEYTFTDGAGFPNRNALAPLTANTALNNSYQHPAPLSQDHAHPFSSSPPPMTSGLSVPREYGSVRALRSDASNGLKLEPQISLRHMKEDAYQDYGLQNLVKVSDPSYLPVKDGQRDVSLGTLGHSGINGSSAWLSTQGDAASVDYGGLSGRGGSFSKMTESGRKTDPTGSPDANYSGEVGSSLADGSSSGMKLSSNLNHQDPSSPYARLAPLEEQTSSIWKWAKSYGRRTINGTVGSTDAATARNLHGRIQSNAIHRGSDLYDEDETCDTPQINIPPIQVQKHRQNLIDNYLLPEDPSCLPANPRRFDAPKKSRKNKDGHGMKKVPSTTAGATVSNTVANTVASSSPSMSGTTARMRSPHRRVPSQDDVFGTKKYVSYNDTAPLSPPMPTAQVGRLSKQQPKSDLVGWKKQKMDEGDSYELHSLEARATEQKEDSTRGIKAAKTDGDFSGLQVPILVRPDDPVCLQPRFRPEARTIARAESPHLHRAPRPTTQALLQRQKELSIMVLFLCFLCPPTLIIYGHGLMDGVIEWLSHGQINAFRPGEKIVALVIGYGGFGLFILGVVAGMVTVAMI